MMKNFRFYGKMHSVLIMEISENKNSKNKPLGANNKKGEKMTQFEIYEKNKNEKHM